jgi:branched-chain amino acid transport system permease protein
MWLAGGAGLLVLPVVAPRLPDFWQFFLTEMAILALLGVSFNLVYGYGGKHSFCQGTFYGLGAYVTAWLAQRGDVPGAVVLVSAALAAAALAFGAGVIFIRMGSHSFIIATVILAIVAFLAGNTLRPLTGGEDGITFTLPTSTLLGAPFPPTTMAGRLHLAGSVLLVVLIGLALVMRSIVGKIVVSIKDNELRAQYLGYSVYAWNLTVFTVGGALAGLAGSLYAMTVGHVSTQVLDLGLSVNAIVWSVVGGLGTVLGPVVGVALLLPLTDYLSSIILYAQIPVGILLILVVRFAPEGIVGALHKLGRGGDVPEDTPRATEPGPPVAVPSLSGPSESAVDPKRSRRRT